LKKRDKQPFINCKKCAEEVSSAITSDFSLTDNVYVTGSDWAISSYFSGGSDAGIGEVSSWRFTQPEPLPPFCCQKHGEIGEEVVQVTDADGEEHYYCKKCAEEILSKATEEAIRWEDELTKRDFEEVEISPRSPKN